MTDLVTAHDLAFRLRVSVDTIRRDCRLGRITGARKWGRMWVMPKEHADAYAASYQPYARDKSRPAVGAADRQDTSPTKEGKT